MSNFDELHLFNQKWRGSDNFQSNNVGNLFFRANIIYTSVKFGVESHDCSVQIILSSGITDGNIEIYSSDSLQAETHHLGFMQNYSSYQFDQKESAIVILGKSPKMGGKYSVRIVPNGKEPSFI